MGTRPLVILIALSYAAVCRGAEPAANAPNGNAANEVGWAWKSERANLLYSIDRASSPYDVSMFRQHDRPGWCRVTVIDRGREIYTWWARTYSVFALNGERLFYANYEAESHGGEVVAVDLKSGKVLWTSRLRAADIRSGHSIYSNSVNMEFVGGRVVVYGNETAGKYTEVKDAATGATIGHYNVDQGTDARAGGKDTEK